MRPKTLASGIILLLLVPSSMAWTQMAGDGGNTGITHLPKGPLDVLGSVDLDALEITAEVQFGPMLLDSPQGSVFVGKTDDGRACNAYVLEATRVSLLTELSDCTRAIRNPHFTVYDATNNLAIACARVDSPNTPLVTAFDLESGDSVWQITPTQLREASPSTTPSSDASGNEWQCPSTAFDDASNVLYLLAYAFGSDEGGNPGSDHRIAAIDVATGEILWASFLSNEQMTGAGTGDAELPEGVVGSTESPFQPTVPQTLTVTSVGLVVAAQVNNQVAFIMLDLEGQVTGVQEAVEPDSALQDGGSTATGTNVRTDLSYFSNPWMVSNGPFAVGALNGEMLILDPVAGEPQLRTESPTSQPFYSNDWVGPARFQDMVLVPSWNGLFALDADTLQLIWFRQISPDFRYFALAGVVPSSDGRIYTLEAHEVHGVRVVQSDPETGQLLGEWPLAVSGQGGLRTPTESDPGALSIRMVATPGIGLRVIEQDGSSVVSVTTIGVNASAPSFGATVSTDVPASGAPLQVILPDNVADFRSVSVFWGDGRSDVHQPGKALEHVYFGGGEQTIVLVATRHDNTTLSQAIPIEVDGVKLSWVEKQFQPDNLDLTFGVIGLAGAVGGTLITLIVTLVKRRRVKREMDVLDDIRETAVVHPVQAMVDLRKYRADLRARAKNGKIEDPPLGSLMQEVTKLFGDVEQRLVGSFGSRMTTGMANAMRAAFADGVLSRSEIDDLQARLKKETKLSKREKGELQDLLANWV